MLKIKKILLFIIIILINQSYLYTDSYLAPTGIEEAGIGILNSVPDVQPMHVHIKNFLTNETEVIAWKTFLLRRTKEKYKKILVTDQLNERGELRVGKTLYNKPYIVAVLPHYAGHIVQYELVEGIVRNLTVYSHKKIPLEINSLALVKDVFGNAVDSFLFKNKLPARIMDLVQKGRVRSIEHLVIDAHNSLRFTSDIAYDFQKMGSYAKKTATAYFWSKTRAIQFSFFDENNGRYNDITPRDVFVAPVLAENEISPIERNDIKEALSLTMQEFPPGMQPLAIGIIIHARDLLTESKSMILESAEYFDVSEEKIKKVLDVLKGSDSFKRIIRSYGTKKVESEMQKISTQSRLSIQTHPKPTSGSILIKNLTTGKTETVNRAELIRQYKSGKLHNVEVLYDRLDKYGHFTLGTVIKEGRKVPKTICSFRGFPSAYIRYIIRRGEVDRSTIILLDNKGIPMDDDKLRYAVDADTGLMRCHLPQVIRRNFQKQLDNIIIFTRVNQSGHLIFGVDNAGKKNVVTAFSRHRRRRVKYRVHKGYVDRTSIVLLNEDITTLKDTNTRFAVNPEMNELQCHLPECVYEELRMLLEGMLIYDRLTNNGYVGFGEDDIEKKQAFFKNHARGRIKYRIHDNKFDKTTILLLNEDGTVLEDSSFRYAVDSETGKIRCHVSEIFYENPRRELDGYTLYDRTDIRGNVQLGKSVHKFGNHPKTRIKYRIKNAAIDQRTMLLLDESGNVLKDRNIRYAADPETGEMQCHLPDTLLHAQLLQLEDLEIHDRLDSKGYIPIRSRESNKREFKNHAKKRVKLRANKGKINKGTIILLDEEEYPFDDGKIHYAIDLKTGRIKCHLPERLLVKNWIDIIDNTEMENYRLDVSHGLLTIGSVIRYHNTEYKDKRVMFRIFNGKMVSIIIFDDNNEILSQEILDSVLVQRAFPSHSEIDYLKTPAGDRIITYDEFIKRIYLDYKEFISAGMHHRQAVYKLQKRLHEMLYVNVHFYFGNEMREDLQIKLKSKISASWFDILRMPQERIGLELRKLLLFFKLYVKYVTNAQPEIPKKISDDLINEISIYRYRITRMGAKHAGELDFRKIPSRKIRLSPGHKSNISSSK